MGPPGCIRMGHGTPGFFFYVNSSSSCTRLPGVLLSPSPAIHETLNQCSTFYQHGIKMSWLKCNSVETAQPGDRTTNPGIVMPKRYASSQRVDSLARVVITPVRHTHTRLHTPLSNICSSRAAFNTLLTSPACLLPQPYPQCSVLRSGLSVLHYRYGESLLGAYVTVLKLGDRTSNPGIVMPAWALRIWPKSQLVGQSSNPSSPPYTHPAT